MARWIIILLAMLSIIAGCAPTVVPGNIIFSYEEVIGEPRPPVWYWNHKDTKKHFMDAAMATIRDYNQASEQARAVALMKIIERQNQP